MTVDQSRIVVRAIRTKQGDDIDVFAFFLYGADIMRIAEISRINREEGSLKGFQRKEIRSHVNSIVEFLETENVLFPNAIILALSRDVEFKLARGSRPDGMTDVGDSGTLSIPLRSEGQQAAWIVDGQQRSLALSRTTNNRIPVPIVAFVSPDLETQREQFILVNKAKPLPTRLINELLPEVGVFLPRDLAARKLPSELCNALNRDPGSPFHTLIKRPSDGVDNKGVVTDNALVEAIRASLKPPMGALCSFKRNGSGHVTDAETMHRVLVQYWSIVRDTFPKAWGLPPSKSRLMHSAGIRVMGALMDPIMLRADSSLDPKTEIRRSLARIAPFCRWTEGRWDELGWRWDEVQSTRQHISRLGDYLIQLDRTLSRPER